MPNWQGYANSADVAAESAVERRVDRDDLGSRPEWKRPTLCFERRAMEIDVRRSPKTVLCVGQLSPETRRVLALLAKRRALRIIHMPCPESLAVAMRGLRANLIVLGPEVSAEVLLNLFAKVDKSHPAVPVVALRPRVDEDWALTLSAFTVVAHPFHDPILLRLVDMALDASSVTEPARGGSGLPS
jgi:hypothetical protein